jgi:hypothetical protein
MLKVGPIAAVAILVGIAAHDKIGREYIRDNGYLGVYINSPFSGVVGISSLGGPIAGRKADIINVRWGEIYEIKPIGVNYDIQQGIQKALSQLLNRYLSPLFASSPAPGGPVAAPNLTPGTRWTPDDIYHLSPVDYPWLPLGLHIWVVRPAPGVIIYIPGPEFVFYMALALVASFQPDVRRSNAARGLAALASSMLVALLLPI